MALKNWRKTDLKTQPVSTQVFESRKGKIIWIRKSSAYNGKWLVGGVNRRGYMKNTYLATKARALSHAKEMMKRIN